VNAETAPRAVVTVTEDYIQSQVPGQTILESLNLVPGVTFTNNDAYGSAGGALNIRGFDGARISLQFDGAQLNDTGNYAVYSNQQLDSELISRATVNLGATEVDSPTASATGGTVNYVSRMPSEEFGGILQYGYGSNDFGRVFGLIDLGSFGPWGTRAWASISDTEYDHFLGNFGGVEKTQFNTRFYQDLGGSDFISLAVHYNENRNNFIRSYNVADFNSFGLSAYQGNVSSCQNQQAAVNGVADAARTCSNVGPLSTNPSNTGNIRIQSRFDLAENLTLTVDPTFQYVLANGGSTNDFVENATGTTLAPNSGSSTGRPDVDVDLNGDGDLLDRVRLFQPNTTTTQRYSLQASLIWDVAEAHRVRFNYTYDWGRHRQVGGVCQINSDSTPADVFCANFGYAEGIEDINGVPIRRRDRISYAILSQPSVEYRGDFMDDALTLTVGLRAPFFTRELNNRCYQALDRNGNNPICTTSAAQIAALNLDAEWQAPFEDAEVEYDDILPNVGVLYRLSDTQQVFASYAAGLSAPRTDDLYGRRLNTLDRVQPETSQAFDLGYRYNSPTLIASATAWFNSFEGRIERVFDPDTNDTGSFNVGDIDLWGADFQLGYAASENFSLIGTASYKDSEIGTSPIAGITGNQLYDTPEWTFAGRAEYTVGNWGLGLQARYVGERFTNLTNTQTAQDYTVVDADLRWNFGRLIGNEGAYLQLNIVNLFDEEYMGNLFTDVSGNRSGQVGAPRTVLATIRTEF
jgi:iron complex outermembrane receptor protein